MKSQFHASAIWQIIEKAVRLPISLLVSILTANYLGADQFGTLTAAHTIILIGAPVASLGVDRVVYGRIGNGDAEAEILSNVIAIKILGFMAVYLILAAYAYSFSSSRIDRDLIMALGLILLFSAFNPIEILLIVKGHGRTKTLIGLGAFAVTTIFRFYLVWSAADLYLFSIAYLLEALALASLLILWSRKNDIKPKFSLINLTLMLGILYDAFPLFLSNIMISIFAKIDILMIDHFLGNASVGRYAVAANLVGLISIFPAVINSSLFPLAMMAKKKSEVEYFDTMLRILSYSYLLGLAMALMFYFFGAIFIEKLYTNDFSASADLLSILCWSAIFQFFGSFSTLWLVNEGLQRFQVYRIAAAMICNVLLNMLWIPAYGIQGAAYATLISYFLASILGNAFTWNTRPIFWLQLKVIFFLGLLRMGR